MAMPTLDDIAREVGVHPSTVSRALNPTRATMVREETRLAVMEAAGRLGYRPHMIARGLQSGRTATIGVIAADLGNPFVTPIIHQITAALETSDMMPVIAETQDDHERFARIVGHMLGRRVDGLVAVAARVGDQQLLEDAARVVPVVVAARPLPLSALPQVIPDDAAGARLAAGHLAELGHRRVAQLQGPLDVANFEQRAASFSHACTELGMEEVGVAGHASRPVFEEGERLARRILQLDGSVPTAVFAHNDLMAMGALAVLRDAGLAVPADVALVGYNDLPMMDLVAPPLTTVRYPSDAIGREAGRLVVELLAGEQPRHVVLSPSLVVRASTRHVGAAND